MRKAVLLILAMLLYLPAGYAQSKSETPGLTDADYRIWGEILCRKNGPARFIFQNSTLSPRLPEGRRNGKPNPLEPVRRKVPDLTDELIADFNSKNKTSYQLERNFTACPNYVLFTEGDVKANFFSPGGEPKTPGDIKAEFPDALRYWQFSRAAVQGDKALIYTKYFCGAGCGSEGYILYEKLGDAWKAQADFNITVIKP